MLRFSSKGTRPLQFSLSLSSGHLTVSMLVLEKANSGIVSFSDTLLITKSTECMMQSITFMLN